MKEKIIDLPFFLILGENTNIIFLKKTAVFNLAENGTVGRSKQAKEILFLAMH